MAWFFLLVACAHAEEPPAVPVGDGLPVVMDSDEGEVYWVSPESPDRLGSGGELRIFLDAETHPHAAASFASYLLGVGGALPVHRHDQTEEIAYIVSGSGVAIGIDQQGAEVEMPLVRGTVWYNPPGVWHAFRNTGTVPLELVFAVIPNEKQGLLSFFRRIGTSPGSEGEPMSAEEFVKLASEHDMTLRPPPDP
jgi:oxalate decarboxylase/phosphoglucose isomerase-like protein (cupin superfamily)